MSVARPLPPLLLLLGVALLAGHVSGLQLSPSRLEHVKYAGQSLVVSCQGRDAVGMVWKGPSGKEITTRTGPVHVEPSRPGDAMKGVDLLLKSIKRKDNGVYTCQARVNGRTEEQQFKLIVYQPIRFTSQRVVFAPEGSDVTLLCHVSGEPKPEVTWRGKARPGEAGPSQHPCEASSGPGLEVIGRARRLDMGPDKKFAIDTETNGLVIRGLARADDGRYRCRATQVNERDSEFCEVDVQLVVQYKPEWTDGQPSEAYGFVGGQANLSCAAEAKPSPGFAWYRAGQLLVNDQSGSEGGQMEQLNTETMSVLQIPRLDPATFGEYRCEARNQHGNISRTIRLVERERPATPQVSVTKTESSRLTLSISIPPEEERPDRYRVEYLPVLVTEVPEDGGWAAATAVEFRPGDSYIINNLQPDTLYALRAAAITQAGMGELSAGLRQRTSQRPAADDPSASGAHQPLVLSLLTALLLAALLVI